MLRKINRIDRLQECSTHLLYTRVEYSDGTYIWYIGHSNLKTKNITVFMVDSLEKEYKTLISKPLETTNEQPKHSKNIRFCIQQLEALDKAWPRNNAPFEPLMIDCVNLINQMGKNYYPKDEFIPTTEQVDNAIEALDHLKNDIDHSKVITYLRRLT